LFAGGAAPSASAELRPPSVKGVLRFWWRALAWSRHAGDLKKIREQEARIFGAAGGENSGGQASFLLRVRPTTPVVLPKDQVLNGSDGKIVGVGARYFGYGLMGAFDSRKTGAKAGQLNRPCLPASFTFTAELVSRGRLDSTVVDALKLMGLLGGLGSRTRRAWGSLSLLSLKQGDAEIWQAPESADAYARQLREVVDVRALLGDEPPYSAFCKHTRVEIVGEDSDPLRLLNNLGEQMLRYRSWGNQGKVLEEDSEQNFKDDHDWFKESEKDSKIANGHPRRVMFGLPHNYSKIFGVQTQNYDRRASPLLVHVHQLGNGSYIAVLTILRGVFLPHNEQLWVWQGKAERPGGNPEKIRPEQLRTSEPDWSVLDAFIDGTSKTTKQPYFPSRTPVLP
jgi:CRISPR-associated protein Cmr1